MFKRLKNIEDKNEEQVELFSKVKTSRLAKNESDYNYDNDSFAFYKFYRDFKNFKNKSLGSKYSNRSKFYNLLKEFKEHQVINPETKKKKIK